MTFYRWTMGLLFLPFIIFVIITYVNSSGGKNNRRGEGLLNRIVKNPLAWVISMFGGFIPLMIILAIINSSINASAKKEKNKYFRPNAGNANMNRTGYTYSQDTYDKVMASQTVKRPVSPNAFGLPDSPRKRRKIVEKFNKKYTLNLSAQDIENLVGGSFMDEQWAREICYMNMDYPTVHSWYGTANPWLKAYLAAFNVLNISSNFSMQEDIVYQSYEQIFSDVLGGSETRTVNEAIREINYKYLTNFDEATFTIALKFMEAKGKHYNVSYAQVNSTHEEIDDLLEKYDKQNQTRTSH